jgi:hypothetical protein
MTLPCLFALLDDHETRRLPADGAVAFVAAGSAPQVLLLAPLAVWRAWRGTVRDRVVAALFAAGALFQFFVAWRARNDKSITPYGAAGIARVFASRVASELVVGPKLFRPVYDLFGGMFPILAVVAVGMLLIPMGGRWSFTRKQRLAGVVLTGLAMWALSYLLRGVPGPAGHDFNGSNSRYVVGPQIFLFLGALVAFEGTRRAVQVKTGVAALWLVVVLIPSIRAVNVRSQGPSWHKELTLAKEQCASAPTSVARIPITPFGSWYLPISCSRL